MERCMRSLLTLSLLALAVTAEAASHRLAYSKAENVEVFVDHADGQPWCSPNLQLRFAFTAAASTEAVQRLLPKLGGLIGTQCANASQLSWHTVDSQGQRLASGSATQAGNWQAVVNAPAPAPIAAVPAAALATAPAASPQAESQASIAVSEPSAPPAAAPDTVREGAAEAVIAATAPAATPATTATPEPATVPPTAPVAPAPLSVDFAVSGWQPPLQRDVLAKANFLSEIVDQNGCRFRLAFVLEDGVKNVSATSKAITCGPDGYAQGTGTLTINRRDGALLHQFNGSYLAGLEFSGKAPSLPIVGFDERKNLLLLLHSEPASKVHYLLRVGYSSYRNNWNAGSTGLVALTENRELFRDLENIRRTIDLATTRLDQSAPAINDIRFYAIRDLQQGLHEGKRDYWMYEINLGRNYRSKQWEYNPQRAENHLFAFERKEAEQLRQAELRRQAEEQRQRELLGQQAEQQLQLYRQLRRETRKPQELYQRISRDASYSPFDGGSYARMLKGGASDYSQIVYISGKTEGGWAIDYPYQAVLNTEESEQDADKGWFLVKGKAQLDTSRQDDQQLPLTLITANTLQTCSESECADLRDPLKLLRHEIGDPEWTPEQAKELVKQAWPERAELQGDDV